MTMPTPVTIHAHLPPATEIRVKITDHGHTVEEFTLHDEERALRYLQDGRKISILEAAKFKATPLPDQADDG
jgi:hypothetical protein